LPSIVLLWRLENAEDREKTLKEGIMENSMTQIHRDMISSVLNLSGPFFPFVAVLSPILVLTLIDINSYRNLT
jgi:hypothetical protein